MTRAPKRVSAGIVIAIACSVLAGACSDVRNSPVSPLNASFAKTSSTTVSVKSTNPAFGDQGTAVNVTINGSGFKPGAQPAWLYNGKVDPTITVSSVNVPNSNTITATITIAGNSPLDFRDVQVINFDRTQGIGDAVFEVTQAQAISGTSVARGANDNGELTGSLTNGGVFYYNSASGRLDTVSNVPAATGFAINPLGNVIAGGSINGSNSPAFLYTRSGAVGTAWIATPLPMDPKATGAAVLAMVTDPATGQPTLLGGGEVLPTVKGCPPTNPIIWSRNPSGSWQRIVLPKNGACQGSLEPRGLSANGTAVGTVNGTAAVWTPNGSGGYNLTLLDANYAFGINGDGSMIVGENGASSTKSTAVYWSASGGGFGRAITFPGGCTASRDIADVTGRATLLDCPFGSNSLTYAAFIDPPYTTPMKLGGVGGHNNNFVGGISPSGSYMVGYGFLAGGVKVGVYWKP